MARYGLKLGSNSHLIFHGQGSTNPGVSVDCRAHTASTEGSCDTELKCPVGRFKHDPTHFKNTCFNA